MPWKADHNANNPSLQTPILVLDVYHIHQMGSVVNQIQSMVIEVIHIPAGCTYLCLCQPVDVGINKPIKTRLTKLLEDWMKDGAGVVNGIAKEPPLKHVAEWLLEAYTTMLEEIVRNAWKKEGYEWV
jgi:hypothetical protein